MAKKYEYIYVEDDGGGLYLYVLDADDNVLAGIHNLEYANTGEWRNVRDALNADALATVSEWEGQMGPDNDYGVDLPATWADVDARAEELVCIDGTLYPDRMGRAAQRYFGVENDTYYTIPQALQVASEQGITISPRTLRYAAKHGLIQGAEKIGRDWFLPKWSLQEYLLDRPKPGRKTNY